MADASVPGAARRYDEEHLRRFLRARADGDAGEMRRWWDALVVDVFDRMDGFVGAAHRGRLDDDEHELAVQLAMIRFSTNLITTFEGVSMGQLVNAAKTLARGICMDVQRRSIRDRPPDAVSLDQAGPGDDAGGSPAWEAEEAVCRMEARERGRDAADFLGWAMPQIVETRRRVLELTFEGAELPEICTELEIGRDNAYARRSRGLKDLARLRGAYEAA